MSTLKREKCWESSLKELKYLETQTDLLVASLSSFSSARQTQTLALTSKKFISTEKIELDTFKHSNNCESILKQMIVTLSSIEKEISSFKASTQRDVLIAEAIALNIDKILKNCKEHVKCCREAFEVLKTETLLSEETAKSVLALVIHQPLLFENRKTFISEIEGLLAIK